MVIIFFIMTIIKPQSSCVKPRPIYNPNKTLFLVEKLKHIYNTFRISVIYKSTETHIQLKP